MASAERIFGLLDRAPAIVSARARPGPHRAGAGRRPAVEFRDVWFAYAGEDWVLRDCRSPSAPGEHVALVGATGEGKTTMRAAAEPRLRRAAGPACWWRASTCASGISRAAPPRRGRVPGPRSLRGHDRGQSRARRRRRRCRPRAGRAALRGRDGGALSWPLPGGLDASVRRARRQSLPRPASAAGHRASPRVQSRVLVLDEATSSVDAESERLIRAAMRRCSTGGRASRSRTGSPRSRARTGSSCCTAGAIHEDGHARGALAARRPLRAAVRAAVRAGDGVETASRRGRIVPASVRTRSPGGRGGDYGRSRRSLGVPPGAPRAVGAGHARLSGRACRGTAW